jgi:NAD(P)-dependent dehydrogenase (short-subunit alcohol dehydrogenase family)
MAERFAEKVALVTGGGSGIGRATALAFAKEGARVVVADIDQVGSEQTVAAINSSGGTAHFVRADVSQEDEVIAMVSATVAAFGRLDCAFNNAGIGGGRHTLHEWDLAEFRRVLDINLTGVWLCMKHELPVMLKQGGGTIVNNASIAGLRGSATIGPYVASKHGVVGLTKVAAIEYAAYEVRVNAVCPGWTDTAILNGLKEEEGLMEKLVARVPIKRLGRPEEIAAAVLWLCSEDASFATGHALALDGGMTA